MYLPISTVLWIDYPPSAFRRTRPRPSPPCLITFCIALDIIKNKRRGETTGECRGGYYSSSRRRGEYIITFASFSFCCIILSVIGHQSLDISEIPAGTLWNNSHVIFGRQKNSLLGQFDYFFVTPPLLILSSALGKTAGERGGGSRRDAIVARKSGHTVHRAEARRVVGEIR